ncbi:hypothetical protein VP424E501_P0244 [Vibrio phage 424E50-1]|nr:hypothetical protein VP501E541_P0230 [Vibrio phage 501E54-1]CAH9014750.1 hypothetical protein VP424E501_P0244 [Vibrio phage 424E50-1]
MIRATNITDEQLNQALEVLRIVMNHTEDNEPWAQTFIGSAETVIEEWPLSSKEIREAAIKKGRK